MNVSSDRDTSMSFDKIAITPAIIHDDTNNCHSHFEEKIFQAIDHLNQVSHKWPDNDSIFDFFNKSTASNISKDSLELWQINGVMA